MSTDTVSNAFGKWPGILQTLGVDPSFLRNVHGPCPICGGKDRFRFDDKGNGEWFCSHCTQKGERPDGFTLLQKLKGLTFRESAVEVDRIIGTVDATTKTKPERTDEEKRAAITAVWKGAAPVLPDSPAWKYLQNRCGDPGPVLDDLRCHPNLRHSKEAGEHPALVAMMRYPNGKCASLHRTFLTPDGHKAPVDPVRKVMPGFQLAGSCVRLGLLQEQIGVAEGIETAICAGLRFGMPVWAAVSANGMIVWEPPEGVKSVVVFGDNDESFTGQQAAFALAKRLKTAGLDVGVQIPGRPGKDWADAQEYLASKFGPEDSSLTE